MKINKFLLACVAGLMLLSSCDDQENKVTYSGPSEVSFKTIEGTAIFGEAPVAGVDKTYNIEVGVTSVSPIDRTVTLEVVAPLNYKGAYDATMAYAKGDIMLLSNNTYKANDEIPAGTPLGLGLSGATWSEAGVAIEGLHYALTKTVIIPAGEFVANCVVTPIFDNLVSTFMDINLKIKSIDNGAIATYRNTIVNKLIKFIPFDEDALLGVYNAVGSSYQVELVKGDVDGVYLLKGEAQGGDVKVKFVYSNPADFHTIVTDDNYLLLWWVSSKYGDAKMYPSSLKGQFSMASPITFSIKCEARVTAGSFGAIEQGYSHN